MSASTPRNHPATYPVGYLETASRLGLDPDAESTRHSTTLWDALVTEAAAPLTALVLGGMGPADFEDVEPDPLSGTDPCLTHGRSDLCALFEQEAAT